MTTKKPLLKRFPQTPGHWAHACAVTLNVSGDLKRAYQLSRKMELHFKKCAQLAEEINYHSVNGETRHARRAANKLNTIMMRMADKEIKFNKEFSNAFEMKGKP